MLTSTSQGTSSRWFVALGLALAASACAPATTGQGRGTAQLIEEARSAGIALVDPLAIEDRMKAEVDQVISRSSSPDQRLSLLRDYIADRVAFAYQTNRSFTAREAWDARGGDCMAYTNLFVALARHLDLRTYFVYVREVRDYYERGGWFFVSSHVAVGHGSGANARVIDLSKELSHWNSMSDWKLAAYKQISDSEALALYYNNVAVDRMLAGDAAGAEQLFRFWIRHEPRVVELHNNLGVLLNREGRYAEALDVLSEALVAFPSFKPLYTNGMLAARSAGRPDVAVELARRGEALEHDDPFFTFARALRLYHEDAYREAAEELERARAAQPDSPVILAWLTRAYLLSGQREEGFKTFALVRQLSPRPRLVHDLTAQFPELR